MTIRRILFAGAAGALLSCSPAQQARAVQNTELIGLETGACILRNDGLPPEDIAKMCAVADIPALLNYLSEANAYHIRKSMADRARLDGGCP